MSFPLDTRDAGMMECGSAARNITVEASAHLPAPGERAALVTVIVPCYNGAAFLGQALSSALNQTHPAMEVIVIDDGSTDNSPEIARGYPVRYIRQANLGLSAARNTGIGASSGEYIVFLDADDRLLPQAVSSGLNALQQHPDCTIAVGDHAFIAADGSHLRKSSKTGARPSAYEALLKSNFIEMISSVLFRRSVFEQVGGFNPSLRVAEDYDLYLRIARESPVCYHSTITAEYRMHGTNSSHNSELMLVTTLQVLKSQKPYVMNDSARRQAFREGLQSWSMQYGRRLARELAGAPSLFDVDQVGHKLRTLALRYPQGLFMILALGMQPARLRRLLQRQETSREKGNMFMLRRLVQEVVQRR